MVLTESVTTYDGPGLFFNTQGISTASYKPSQTQAKIGHLLLNGAFMPNFPGLVFLFPAFNGSFTTALQLLASGWLLDPPARVCLKLTNHFNNFLSSMFSRT